MLFPPGIQFENEIFVFFWWSTKPNHILSWVRQIKKIKKNHFHYALISNNKGADTLRIVENSKNPVLTTSMDNHVYQFDGKIRVQNKGGPIGLKLTGEIADCLMIDWDKKLLEELKRHNMVIEVYTRFKDDIGIAMESCEKGSRLIKDKIVVDERETKL